ncbi:hypothetical protein [Mangrovitalea sediminis]|uniref:hypothetical protein n=1 Tax=Mangrovitalea sediminis TaxID=1982043 RepID=UPI0018E961C2|nr:hypothetical protein [Mangrovitalea sediminis]
MALLDFSSVGKGGSLPLGLGRWFRWGIELRGLTYGAMPVGYCALRELGRILIMGNVDKVYPSGLKAVLYFLNYIPDVYNEDKYKSLSSILENNYSKEEVERYLDAVEWALNNMNSDVNRIDSGLHQSDEDVMFFLKKFKFLCNSVNTRRAQ